MHDLITDDIFAVEPIEEAFRKFLRPWRSELVERAPAIRLDVNESDANYTVKAEIPGVKKEDVDVRIDGNQITISAEIKKESEDKQGERLLRSERQYGYASRSFTLACPVDETRSDAKYQDGILELTLPKRATNSSRRLQIA